MYKYMAIAVTVAQALFGLAWPVAFCSALSVISSK